VQRFPIALVLTGTALAIGCDGVTGPGESATASIEIVAGNPEAFLGKTVQLTGRLENRGTNYFTDMELAITDEDGHFVRVRPWLPLEVAQGNSQRTLSQFLERPVALTGVMVRDSLQGVGETYLLEVDSAVLL
jgi:hypothetical protein